MLTLNVEYVGRLIFYLCVYMLICEINSYRRVIPAFQIVHALTRCETNETQDN
jgi:hypothetical protein